MTVPVAAALVSAMAAAGRAAFFLMAAMAVPMMSVASVVIVISIPIPISAMAMPFSMLVLVLSSTFIFPSLMALVSSSFVTLLSALVAIPSVLPLAIVSPRATFTACHDCPCPSLAQQRTTTCVSMNHDDWPSCIDLWSDFRDSTFGCRAPTRLIQARQTPPRSPPFFFFFVIPLGKVHFLIAHCGTAQMCSSSTC